jgi:6-pyruvoyltetrahydropterin/6-carboxytetrahydropterin synthase
MFEITVQRVFSAAHAIRLYDGSLEPVHGHNWPVEVTVAAAQLDAIEVVMDFHLLETLIDGLMQQVHNRSLNDVPPFGNVAGTMNPTAERVAWWIGTEVAKGLPANVKLISVKVGEAPGCFATYRP